jgi:ribonuclease PH
MTEAGNFVEVQGTAEGEAFDRATMNRLLDLGQLGISELIALQKKTLGITG